MKKALVLSGGSIKGAFQAGVLAELLSSGSFEPEAIYGTSVGSLNGAFLAERAGRAAAAGVKPNWLEIGNQLQDFWLQQVNSFSKIGRKRGIFSLLVSLISKNFRSFLDMSPLDELLKQEIKLENLEKSPVKFYACAVNIRSGEPVYATVDSHRQTMHDYIMASTAIPLVMPLRFIQKEPYVDGGIREVAPLSQAIKDGATQIICVICQPRVLSPRQSGWKNAVELMERDMDIVTNETVNNDVDQCQEINELLKQFPQLTDAGPLKGKRHIDLLEIRPAAAIELELENFDSDQIRQALKQGWETSRQARQNCSWLKA